MHLEEVIEKKPASSRVVSLGKALDGTPPPLCRRQVTQTPRKWQLPSECGRTVQKDSNTIRFLVNKYKQYKNKIILKYPNFQGAIF